MLQDKKVIFLVIVGILVFIVAFLYFLGRMSAPGQERPKAPTTATPTASPRSLQEVIREDLSAPREETVAVPESVIRELSVPGLRPSAPGGRAAASVPTTVPQNILDSLTAPQ